ncbi:hypothetical protein [Treponema bryantii]|uniref:hypothetical protein n=1 Tax=Treponema bryantii TaxID=163 RepID=UPI002B2CAC39|nr:hypothetical protein TRBR_11880 [Treponema bryantii]
MKRTFISTMLLLISTIFFFGCQHELENPNQQFVFSTDPIFPKTDCDVLVDEEVNLSDGNWIFQERSNFTINNSFTISLTPEQKEILFNSLSDDIERNRLNSYEINNQSTEYYYYKLPLTQSFGSACFKFQIENTTIISNKYNGYFVLFTDDDFIKKIFRNVPKSGIDVQQDKIIYTTFVDYNNSLSTQVNVFIDELIGISKKELNYKNLDILKNQDCTKYYYRNYEFNDDFIEKYLLKE